MLSLCNSTFIHLGLRLGNAGFIEYAQKLGFNVKINNQSPPALLGNASIGQQGVLVSPLQIANLYATIGRKGFYSPWRIVSQIRNHQGDVIQEFPVKRPEQILKAETCAFLIKALAEVTRERDRSTGLVGRGMVRQEKQGRLKLMKRVRLLLGLRGFLHWKILV